MSIASLTPRRAEAAPERHAHQEAEKCANISGGNKEVKGVIRAIWGHVADDPHYMPLAHKREIQRSGPRERKKYYHDTLDLLLTRAGVQVRLEEKKGNLVCVIKIGSKEEPRLEECAVIDKKTWKKDGPWQAFRKGMKQGGRDAELQDIKSRLKEVLPEGVCLSDLKLYRLQRTRSNSMKALYNGKSRPDTALEIKTDRVKGVTLLGDKINLDQVEVEVKNDGGDAGLLNGEIQRLVNLSPGSVKRTAQSKPDPGFEALQQYLWPQDNSLSELGRAFRNREILGAHAKKFKFRPINPQEAGLTAPPATIIALGLDEAA